MSIELNLDLTRDTGFRLKAALSFSPGRVTALYGPSGAGKTTILRLLAGLERGTADDKIEVIFNGNTWQSDTHFVPPHQRRIGYVFQHLHLFPHLNVRDNLEFAARRAHRPRHNKQLATTKDKQQILALLDLTRLLDVSIDQLSGGERQRVAIGRALFSQPEILVMDEPLGALDPATRARILPYLQKLQARLDIPLIYVSHAFDEVTYLSDFIHVMAAGRVVKSCSVIEFARDPQQALSEPDAAAIIQCQVVRQDTDYALTEIDFEAQRLFISDTRYKPGDSIRLRVPARELSLTRVAPETSSILNLLQMKITDIQDPGTGASAMITLTAGEQHLLARITRKSLARLQLITGEDIFVQIKGVALVTGFGDSGWGN